LQTEVLEKVKTHILCSVTFFQILCLWWDNMEKYCWAGQSTAHIACLIPKATNTFSEYVIVIAFLLQQCLHERASVVHYTYVVLLTVIRNETNHWHLPCFFTWIHNREGSLNMWKYHCF